MASYRSRTIPVTVSAEVRIGNRFAEIEEEVEVYLSDCVEEMSTLSLDDWQMVVNALADGMSDFSIERVIEMLKEKLSK